MKTLSNLKELFKDIEDLFYSIFYIAFFTPLRWFFIVAFIIIALLMNYILK